MIHRSQKYWFVAIGVVAYVLGTACLAQQVVFDPIRRWTFEDGKPGSWQYYENWKKPEFSVTRVRLEGKFGLQSKFDDTSTVAWFDKGFMAKLDPAIEWRQFNFISFRYRIDRPVENVRVFFSEDDGDWWGWADPHPTIGKAAEFYVRSKKLRFLWTDAKDSDRKRVGKATRIFISVHNKEPVNSKLQFCFEVDDIVLGNDICRPPYIVRPNVGTPMLAIAAQTTDQIVVDGKLADWAGAVPISLTSSQQLTIRNEGGEEWRGHKDLAAVLLLLWDEQNLYFAANVQDDILCCADSRTDYDLSRNDSVRLYLRTTLPLPEPGLMLGKNDYAFCMTPFSPKGSSPQLILCSYGGEKHKTFPLSSVRCASSRAAHGYVIELAIPWHALGVKPAEGLRLGFYALIDDSDHPGGRDHELVWRVTGAGYWKDASQWGRLLLTRKLSPPEALCAAGTTGSVVPSPDKQQYEMNQDVNVSLNLWKPLRATAHGVVWRVLSPEGSPARGKIQILPPTETKLSTVLHAVWNCGTSEDGLYTLICTVGSPSVSFQGLAKLIGISEDKRRKEIAQARAQIVELRDSLKTTEIPNSWSVGKLFHARRGAAYIERVEPAKWSLVKDPVTWDDLGGSFQGLAQCGTDARTLDTFFKHYNFGRVIKPHFGNVLCRDWRTRAEDVARRNLIMMSVWGYVPGRKKWEYKIPKERHNALRQILGRRFFGYEIGEQDGRFVGSIAPIRHPTSRKEARRYFVEWHENELHKPMHHFLVSLGSLNYCHQYGALGYRMLGLEVAQGLPSDIMEWAFLRGAGKQYGLLTWNCISIFNRWGYKSYTHVSDRCGPDKGTSVSLMRRLYYVTFLYGAATVGFESAYFTKEKDSEGFPKLSPVGKVCVHAVKWCRQHAADVGVQHTPVALLIDFYSGWQPPRHLYTRRRYLVWGNMPYKKGDYQIDNFFRWIYPQYEDASYFKDERGFLTATPFGDKFDVLTSDVSERVLRQYGTVLLLGELPMTGDLIERLKRFVQEGGDLVMSADEAAAFGTEFTKVQVSDKMLRGYAALSLADAVAFQEKDYLYRDVSTMGARILAISEDRKPLITVANYGKGRAIVITPDYWMTTRLQVKDNEGDVHPQRYELLHVVQHVLGRYFKDWDFINVDGTRIQYIVNLSSDKRRLLLTLVNNTHSDWSGSVTLKDGELTRVKEWMEGKELLPISPLKVSVPAGDLRVLELKSSSPLFRPMPVPGDVQRSKQ